MQYNKEINAYRIGSAEIDKIRLANKAENVAKAQQTTVRYIYHDDNEIVFHVVRTIRKRMNDSAYNGYDLANKGEFHFSRVVEIRYIRNATKPMAKILGVTFVSMNRKVANVVSMPVIDNAVRAEMIASAMTHANHISKGRFGFDMRKTWNPDSYLVKPVAESENHWFDDLLDKDESEKSAESPVQAEKPKRQRKPRANNKAK